MDYNSPGSSVHGVLQARILEWMACHFLFQIFPTQGSKKQGLLHCRQILCCLSHPFSVQDGRKTNCRKDMERYQQQQSNCPVLQRKRWWSIPIKNQPKALTFLQHPPSPTGENADTHHRSVFTPPHPLQHTTHTHTHTHTGVSAKDSIRPSECRSHHRSYCSVKKERERFIH